MKIYNKGVRTFHYGDKPEDNIIPATFKEVPDAAAAKLIADYPREIVAADDYAKDRAANAGALAAKEAALNAEKAESAVKDAKIKLLEKQLAGLQRLTTTPDSPFPSSVDTRQTPKRNGGR